MPYANMTLRCQQCGEPFIFTVGEQEYYSEKGLLHEPTRCPHCRETRKQRPDPSPKPKTKRSTTT